MVPLEASCARETAGTDVLDPAQVCHECLELGPLLIADHLGTRGIPIDLGQRPFLYYNVPVRGRIGTLESEVLEEFWRALSIHLGATIHVDLIRGRNRHHLAERIAR